ncbi:MAG: hypothetical protein ABI947_11370 [Chloroflexota bacterium]
MIKLQIPWFNTFRTIPHFSEKASLFAERHQRAIVLAIMAVGLAYYVMLIPGYQLGQNNDDAHYIMLARNLAAGKGFIDESERQARVDTFVPPGYPLLLAPVAFVFPNAILPLQLTSLLFTLGTIVLIYRYLKLKRLPLLLNLLIVFLFAINPTVAKFATLVMAEAAFGFCLMLTLIALYYYEKAPLAFTRTGLACVLFTAGLFYLKTAAITIPLAVVLYFVLIRKPRHALVVAIGTGALIGGLFLSRIAIGDPAIGYGYANELSFYYFGTRQGIVLKVVQTVLNNIWLYLTSALNVTIAPTVPGVSVLASPFAMTLGALYSFTIAPIILVGWLIWWRLHRDVSILIFPAYFGTTLLYPFVHERRVILVLPIVLMFFCVGLYTVLIESLPKITSLPKKAAQAMIVSAVVLILITIGMRAYTDYYLTYIQPLSKIDISSQEPWLQFLSQVPTSTDVVENGQTYLYHFLTGKKYTNQFVATCQPILSYQDASNFWSALYRQYPRFVLLSGIIDDSNKYDVPIKDCLLPMLQQNPDNFARVYSQPKDKIQIYEVLRTHKGPESHELLRTHETRTNLTATMPRYLNSNRGVALNASPNLDFAQIVTFDNKGLTQITVPFAAMATVDTIALGQAGSQIGKFSTMRVMLQSPDGKWQTLDTLNDTRIGFPEASAVDGGTARPYYYLQLSQPILANAVRIEFDGAGWYYFQDLNVFGTPANYAGKRPTITGTLPASVDQGSWRPVVGQWDGKRSSIGLYDGNLFYLPGTEKPLLSLDGSIKDMNDPNAPIPVVGDWENVKQSEPGVFYKGAFFLQYHDGIHVVAFGQPGDRPVVGDWNGDGVDTFGVYRKGAFYLTDSPTGSAATYAIPIRIPSPDDPDDLALTPLAGDWNGDGKDTIGVYTGAFVLWNSLKPGLPPDQILSFGVPGDVPIVGDWNGDGVTNIGVVRDSQIILSNRSGQALVESPHVEVSKIVSIPFK